ncbi:MAG TPA: peptide ABC transporter substrate-binding protein [Burkholderiales bacterium]|nr:peptide ABC transporter substrate-binding protein [Burkholderiales bacterium]
MPANPCRPFAERLAFVAVAALVAMAAGCGKPPTRVSTGDVEQVLHKGNKSDPQELDPHIVQGVPEHHILQALVENLVTEDPKDLHPIPGQAERWDISADGTVYTFHLREGIRWSNGDPVTAHDFVRSYQRGLSPSLASEYAYMYYVMKGAEDYFKGKTRDFSTVGAKALDDRTLQITLNGPVPYFLSLLNHYSWWPVHMPTVAKYGDPYQRNNRWTRPGHFVGNGPFVLDKWKVGQVIVVKKNPLYWNAANVKLKAIHFHPIESSDTEERSFRSGQLHVSDEVPLSKIPVYRAKKSDLLRIDPYLGCYFYRMNTTRPQFKDKRVRQALAMAVDRKAIVERVTRGGQLPAFYFTPPDTVGYTSRTSLRYDPEAARKLLAQAGYPGGKGFPAFEILYNTSEAHKAIGEAVQQMWKRELGIEVRLLNQEWKVYLDTEKRLDYEVSRGGWIGDYPDPSTFLETFLSDSGNNRTGWKNAEYDRLLKEAARLGDQKTRYELFQKAEAIFLDELPIIPIYHYTRVYLIQPSVRGWSPTILDHHPYQNVWLAAPTEAVAGVKR